MKPGGAAAEVQVDLRPPSRVVPPPGGATSGELNNGTLGNKSNQTLADGEEGSAPDLGTLCLAKTKSVVTRSTVDALVKKWDEEIDKKNDDTDKLADKVAPAELSQMLYTAGFGARHYATAMHKVPSIKWDGLTIQDGPQGYRTQEFTGAPARAAAENGCKNAHTALQMPACAGVSFSWDQDHATVYGLVNGKVFKFHGASASMGPGAQLIHHPLNGRNFEYAGSEDPCLGGRIVESIARGQTSQGLLSILKHYLYNDWETTRQSGAASNVVVPLAASMELYVRPFVSGLSAGVQGVMCAYNWFKNTNACANKELLGWLTKLHRRFFIASDYWLKTSGKISNPAAATAALYLEAGLNLELPSKEVMLYPEQADEKLKRESASRILAAAADANQLFGPDGGKKDPPYYETHTTMRRPPANTYEEWRNVTRQLTVEQMVLLKNEGILPLKPDDKLYVDSGTCGVTHLWLSGGGSGVVGGQQMVWPWEGIGEAAKKGLLKKAPAKEATYKLICRSQFSMENQDLTKANQDEIYQGNGQINGKTIVFLSVPGQVPVGELEGAGAIIYSLFPGHVAGHALADLLTGVYNPGGKLAMSLFGTTDDWNPVWNEYKTDTDPEGLLLGYRRYIVEEKKKDKVKFWFGFGLPYFPPGMATANAWEDLITVDVKLHNKDVRGIYFCVTSKVSASAKPAAEHQKAALSPSPVVQFYAQKKKRNYPELISFRKIHELQPAETACRVAFYDPVHIWKTTHDPPQSASPLVPPAAPGEGSFVDQEDWKLLVSLNGPREVKPVEEVSPKVVTKEPDGAPLKKYASLKEVYTGLRERHAAELLLWQDHGTDTSCKKLEPVFLADKVPEEEVDALWNTYLERAKRSPITTKGEGCTSGDYKQPNTPAAWSAAQEDPNALWYDQQGTEYQAAAEEEPKEEPKPLTPRERKRNDNELSCASRRLTLTVKLGNSFLFLVF
eukprot:g11078.t1